MATDEAPFLTKGVEVSAKYKGAYCEAKVKHVEKVVKCKVVLKESGKTLIVSDEELRGSLKIGATVQVRSSDTGGQYVEGVLTRVHDQSMYTVVFDDGDENRLKRTKLCPKGARHFMKSETLDDLPLTHPERFGTPVVKSAKAKTAAVVASAGTESDSDVESSDGQSDSGGGGRVKLGGSGLGHTPQQNIMGNVVCVDVEDRSRKSVTVPALVVLPSADDHTNLSKHHVLVKSFRDNRFLTTTAAEIKDFESVMATRKIDKLLKFAFDKAKQYMEKNELPPSWDRNELLGYSSDESSESDDEAQERDDCFVAQLYKFMDDRGTPINKVPTVAGKDISLSKLFRLVQVLGGYNKVTNHMKWHVVCRKLLLSNSSAQSTVIKSLYKKYLHAFEDFNRKLGCTMESTSRADRRQVSNRSLVSFRERERGERDRSPKSSPSVASVALGRSARDEEMVKSSGLDRMPRVSLKSDASNVKTESIVQLAASKSDITKSDQGKSLQVKSSSKRDPDESKMSSSTSYKSDTDIASKKSGDVERKSKDLEISGGGSERSTKGKDLELSGGASGRMTRAEAGKTSGRREDRKRGPGNKIEEVGGWGESERSDKSGIESEREEKMVVQKRSRRIASSAMTDDGGGDVVRDDVRDDPDTVDPSYKTADSDSRSRRKSVSEDAIIVGSKLNVKYGKGKHQKIYEAKVLDVQDKGGSLRYMVHYSGWNSRYDEWVRRDVIDSVKDEPIDTAKAKPVVIQPKSAAHRKKRSNDSTRSAVKDGGEEVSLSKSKPTKISTESSNVNSVSAAIAAKNTRMPVDVSKSGIKSPGRIGRRTRTRSTAMDPGAESDDESSDNDNDSSSDDDSSSFKSSPLTKPRSPALAAGSPASTVKPAALSKRKDMTSAASEEDSESEADSSRVKDGGPRWRTRVPRRRNSECMGAGDASNVMTSKLKEEKEEGDTEENKRESLGAPELTLPENQIEGRGDEKLEGERLRSDSVSSEKHMERMPDLIPALEEQPLASSTGESDEGNSQSGSEDKEEKTEGKEDKAWRLEESEAAGQRKRGAGRSMVARQMAESIQDKNRFVEDSKKYTTPGKRRKPAETESVSPDRKLAKSSKEVAASELMKPRNSVIALSSRQDDSAGSGTESERKNTNKSKKHHGEADKSSSDAKGDVKVSNIDTFAFNDDDEDAIPELHPQKSKISAATVSLLALEESMKEEELKEERIYEPVSEAEERFGEDDDKLEEQEVEEFEEEFEEKVEEMPVDDASDAQQGLTMALFDACLVAGNELDNEDQRRAEAAETLLMSHRQPHINESLHPKMMPSSSYHDSPPDSSVEQSPSSSAEPDDSGLAGPSGANIGIECGASDERNSTKSEREANLEVEAYMRRDSRIRELCGAGVDGSPSGFEFSAASNDESSVGGSSGSAEGRHKSEKRGAGLRGDYTAGASSLAKSKKSSMIEEQEDFDDDDDDDDDEMIEEKPVRKRVRRKKGLDKSLSSSVYKSTELSDSDDGVPHNDSIVIPARSKTSPNKSSRCHTHKLSRSSGSTGGVMGRYNFLDMEDGKYLEGDERIEFLTKKITDLRTVYMSLKAEVACIDRRRKRHRGREHRSDVVACNTSLVVSSAAGSAQSSATTSGGGVSNNPTSAPVT